MFLRTLALGSALSIACAFGAMADQVTYNATLNATSEVPPTKSTGSGTATAVLDTKTHELTVDVTFSGFASAVTAAHIHGPAAAGKNAGVVVPLGSNPTSPIHKVAKLTAAQEKELASGMMYVNIHSKNNPGGAIRGQLTK